MPSHRVRLHYREICHTSTPFQTSLACAQRVYAQYDIEIVMASGQSLGLSPRQAQRFEQVDGSCEWNITGGEYADLQRLGGSVPMFDVLVFYVNRFSEANLLGCGGHLPNRPACIVAAAAGRWVTAHEVGHVLLGSAFRPVHSPDTNNLMYEFARNQPATPTLTPQQVRQMKTSPCCVRVC